MAICPKKQQKAQKNTEFSSESGVDVFQRIVFMEMATKKQPSALSPLKEPEGPRLRFS